MGARWGKHGEKSVRFDLLRLWEPFAHVFRISCAQWEPHPYTQTHTHTHNICPLKPSHCFSSSRSFDICKSAGLLPDLLFAFSALLRSWHTWVRMYLAEHRCWNWMLAPRILEATILVSGWVLSRRFALRHTLPRALRGSCDSLAMARKLGGYVLCLSTLSATSARASDHTYTSCISSADCHHILVASRVMIQWRRATDAMRVG